MCGEVHPSVLEGEKAKGPILEERYKGECSAEVGLGGVSVELTKTLPVT